MATIPQRERRITFNIKDGTAHDEPQNNPYRKDSGKGNRKGQIRGKNGQQIMQYSFRSVVAFGIGIRLARQGNEVIGAYTGRRMRQQRMQNGMNLGIMAAGAVKFGALGMIYAAGNLGYQGLLHHIGIQNENIKSERALRRSGNVSHEGSRQSGGRV